MSVEQGEMVNEAGYVVILDMILLQINSDGEDLRGYAYPFDLVFSLAMSLEVKTTERT